MKRNFLFAALVMTFAAAISISAQSKPTDFSGKWNLDVSKSKMGDRMPVESQTLTVAQTVKELMVETDTKRPEPPANNGGRAGGGRMGGMGGGDAKATYGLDGKETKTEIDGQMGKTTMTYKAKFDGPKLKLSSTRNVSSPMGEFTIPTNETWELSADGKTLTIDRETVTPRSTISSTLVYAKQ